MIDITKNEVLKKGLVNNGNFEDLGSIKELCQKIGSSEIYIDNFTDDNICLIVNSEQEIVVKLYCSKAMTKIIKEIMDFPENFIDYRVLRITRTNGSKYIRVSQNISFRMDPEMTIDDCIEATKSWKGNVTFSLHMGDIKSEPISNKPPINPKDSIAF